MTLRPYDAMTQLPNYPMTKSTMKDICNTPGDDARFDSSGCILKEKIYPFIYPARGEGGGYTRLFKVLLTNICENNCLYCVNRKDRNKKNYIFSPKELALRFMNYYKGKMVDGLFISSGIYRNSDTTQERIIETVKILRERYGYKGYIHTKILPGASPELIREAVPFSNRISVNLEAPGDNYLTKLSKEKNFTNLISTLRAIANARNEKRRGYMPYFSITTQFVTGAAGESDLCLLTLSKRLYRDFGLSRVYYSGFSPEPDTPLDNKSPCPIHRIRRLYQADFLIRKYNFDPREIVPSGFLPDIDPKLSWAESHPEKFPVEINKASYDELIRVPGIGLITARRILRVRKDKRFISPDDTKKIGVRGHKYLDFLTFNGKYYGNLLTINS